MHTIPAFLHLSSVFHLKIDLRVAVGLTLLIKFANIEIKAISIN